MTIDRNYANQSMVMLRKVQRASEELQGAHSIAIASRLYNRAALGYEKEKVRVLYQQLLSDLIETGIVDLNGSLTDEARAAGVVDPDEVARADRSRRTAVLLRLPYNEIASDSHRLPEEKAR